MIREPLILFGAGGHARSCIDVIEEHNEFKIAGFVDLNIQIGCKYLGYNVIGRDSDLTELAKTHHNAIISVGQIKSPKKRIKIYNKIKKFNFNLPIIVSPFAHVSRHAIIGEGSIIMHGAIVNAGAKIGRNCIINSQALIEHDTLVGDHCHISTGAILNGNVIVGEGSFLGSGCIIKEGVEIKKESLVSFGLKVHKDFKNDTQIKSG